MEYVFVFPREPVGVLKKRGVWNLRTPKFKFIARAGDSTAWNHFPVSEMRPMSHLPAVRILEDRRKGKHLAHLASFFPLLLKESLQSPPCSFQNTEKRKSKLPQIYTLFNDQL